MKMEKNTKKENVADSKSVKAVRPAGLSGGWMLLCLSLMVLQTAIAIGLYFHNIQLSMELGKREVMHEQALKNMTQQICPTNEQVLSGELADIHRKLEDTSNRIGRQVSDIEKRVSVYAKKLESTLGSVLNNPLLKEFGL